MESLLFYLFLAIGISFLCSILEAVILSITPSYIQLSIQNGKYYGELLKKFKSDIDRPLAAILTLNTFAHTIGAAGVGAEAQSIWGEEYLSIASAIVTILILVFSEIIPKTIGATYWNSLAPISAYLLKGLYVLLYPFVIAMQLITRLITKGKKKTHVTRHVLSIMTDISHQSGNLEEDESKIIQNLLKFSEILTEDIMTPRTVVVASEENTSIKDLYETDAIKHFSRIPIFAGDKDQITGYVLKEDILRKIIDRKGKDAIKTCKIEILKVNEHMPLPELYQKMTATSEHIAIVTDEYGGLAGLVSMEDIIETLLGVEITDESDQIEDLQKYARKNWEYRAKKLGILAEDIFISPDENGEET